jgi:hypothetical protein
VFREWEAWPGDVYDVNTAMFRHLGGTPGRQPRPKTVKEADAVTGGPSNECDDDRLLQNWTQQVSLEVSALLYRCFLEEVDNATVSASDTCH